MIQNKNHKENEDLFSQIFKEKLENHEMKVDDTIWSGIEQKMEISNKRGIKPLWYWISGGVAAAIVLLFIFNPFNDKNLTNQLSNSINFQKNESNQKVETPIIQPKVKEKSQNLVKVLNSKKRGNNFENRSKNKQLQKSETSAIGKSTSNENQSMDDEKPKTQLALNEGDNQSQKEVSTSKKENENFSNQSIQSLQEHNDLPQNSVEVKKSSKKKAFFLALSFGSEGGFSSTSQNLKPTNPLVLNSFSLSNEGVQMQYFNILDRKDYSQVRYNLPVSFSITFFKPINEFWGWETGLTYTYLSSDYYRPGSVSYHGNLQLHYLGIPLNARVVLFNRRDWNIYLSAGGMIEKGLHSTYRQETIGGNYPTTMKTESSIDGLQWSLDGAMGIDYKIQRNISLFVEPKITYYLQNNQPMSSRTEMPLNVGLNGGLRIGF